MVVGLTDGKRLVGPRKHSGLLPVRFLCPYHADGSPVTRTQDFLCTRPTAPLRVLGRGVRVVLDDLGRSYRGSIPYPGVTDGRRTGTKTQTRRRIETTGPFRGRRRGSLNQEDLEGPSRRRGVEAFT